MQDSNEQTQSIIMLRFICSWPS